MRAGTDPDARRSGAALGPPGPGAGEVGENAHAHGCFQVAERGSRSKEDSPVPPPLAKGLTGWTDAFKG